MALRLARRPPRPTDCAGEGCWRRSRSGLVLARAVRAVVLQSEDGRVEGAEVEVEAPEAEELVVAGGEDVEGRPCQRCVSAAAKDRRLQTWRRTEGGRTLSLVVGLQTSSCALERRVCLTRKSWLEEEGRGVTAPPMAAYESVTRRGY